MKHKPSSSSYYKIAGIHAVTAQVIRRPQSIKNIYYAQERQDQRLEALLNLAKNNSVRCQSVTREQLTQSLPHVMHQGVIAECEGQQAYTESDLDTLLELTEQPILLILDGVQDPHNLGACLRTANAANVAAVIIPKDRAAQLTPTVSKVACGAAELTPVVAVTNLARTLTALKEHNIWLYGLDMDATTTIYDTNLKGGIGFILGNEGEGLRMLTKKHCDGLLNIPMEGDVASLNVSVATGIVLFECLRQRNK